MILAIGARQLVVHEALDTMSWPAYLSSLTPITNIGASPDGAEITTFLAPPFMWSPAFSSEVKTPVDSTTKSAPALPHGMADGSFSPVIATCIADADGARVMSMKLYTEIADSPAGCMAGLMMGGAHLLPIDHEAAVHNGDVTAEAAVRGIVLEHVRLCRFAMAHQFL